MGRNGKDPRITLPVALQLTDEGRYFFNKHPAGLPKGNSQGICLDSFPASTLQRLIMADYISLVELGGSGFSENRKELIDLSKLIMYSALYGRFNGTVWKAFSRSDILVRYNRSHPKAPFIREHMSHGSSIEHMDGEAAGEAKKLLNEIAWRASTALEREIRDLDEQERRNKHSLAIRYLSNIKSPFWFLFAGSSDRADYQALVDKIEGLLKAFLRKSRISDYIALLLVELVIRSETEIIKHASQQMKNPFDLKTVLQNSDVRKQLLAAMEKQGKSPAVLWKIRGSRYSIGTDNRLEIIILGSDQDEKGLKERVASWKSLDVKKDSPGDFYEELFLSGDDPGLLYLNRIEEICAEENIRFESHASRVGREGSAAIRLALHFR